MVHVHARLFSQFDHRSIMTLLVVWCLLFVGWRRVSTHIVVCFVCVFVAVRTCPPHVWSPVAELLGVQKGDGARLHGDAPLLLLLSGGVVDVGVIVVVVDGCKCGVTGKARRLMLWTRGRSTYSCGMGSWCVCVRFTCVRQLARCTICMAYSTTQY